MEGVSKCGEVSTGPRGRGRRPFRQPRGMSGRAESVCQHFPPRFAEKELADMETTCSFSSAYPKMHQRRPRQGGREADGAGPGRLEPLKPLAVLCDGISWPSV